MNKIWNVIKSTKWCFFKLIKIKYGIFFVDYFALTLFFISNEYISRQHLQPFFLSINSYESLN